MCVKTLTGMFDFFDVTSLSSFRRRFYAYRLCPNPGKKGKRMWKLDGSSEAGGGKGEEGCCVPETAGLGEVPEEEGRAGGSGSAVPRGFISNDSSIMLIARSRSVISNENCSTSLNKRNEGMSSSVQCEGVLRQKGALADIVRVGRFEIFSHLNDHDHLHNYSQNQQQGYGAIYTPRGEMFHGFFKDGAMWGPGVYVFPVAGAPSQSNEHERNKRRVRFQGMHNGKPKGLGCMTWSDGSEEWGLFDGYELLRECDESECQGVVLVAEENAEFAKRVVSEILDELQYGTDHKENWEAYGGILLQGLALLLR